MAITGIGQGAMSNQIQHIEQVRQEHMAGQVQSTVAPGQPANVDRVEISALSKTSISATAPKEKPQMYRLFTEEIEAAIGRIESIIRNPRFNEVTGSLMEGQRGGIINEPEKGIGGKIGQRIAEKEQQAQAEKAQETAQKNMVSIRNASLSTIVDTIKNEQQQRNAQVQTASQMVH